MSAEDQSSSFNTELASISLDEVIDEDELRELNLIERLESEELYELRKRFYDCSAQKRAQANPISHYSGVPLSKDQFVNAINTVIGNSLYSVSAVRLFSTLDRASNLGVIWWEQVLDHVIEKLETKRQGHGDQSFIRKGVVHVIPHCKRETIVKVVPIHTGSHFCYTVISRFGRCGIYDVNMQILDSYVVPLRDDSHAHRARCTWITDAVHLPDASSLIILSSDRSLRVYDCSGLIHAPVCHVVSLPYVPNCAEYVCGRGGGSSLLFIGDEHGDIISMKFLQPTVLLFRKKHPDKLDRYYWSELKYQSEFLVLKVYSRVHHDGVRQLKYFQDNDTLVSCSQDPTESLVIRNIGGRKAPYEFRVSRGVRCFHLDKSIHLLVTGSSDGVVRLWNPVVTRIPTTFLYGHRTAVYDVMILSRFYQILSCGKDGVKVWDIQEQCCLQTITFQIDNDGLEFSNRAFYKGLSCLIFTYGNQLASIEVFEPEPPSCAAKLPPPSREYRAAVPSPWKAADARTALTPDSSPKDKPSSTPVTIMKDDQEDSSRRRLSARGLFMRKTQQDRHQQEMRRFVSQCTPHLALKLTDLAQVRFSRSLPITTRMKTRAVDVSDPEKIISSKYFTRDWTQMSTGSRTSSSERISTNSTLLTSMSEVPSPVAFGISAGVIGIFLACLCYLCGKSRQQRRAIICNNTATVTMITTQPPQTSAMLYQEEQPPPYTPPPDFLTVVPPQFPRIFVTSQSAVSSNANFQYPETPPPEYSHIMSSLSYSSVKPNNGTVS